MPFLGRQLISEGGILEPKFRGRREVPSAVHLAAIGFVAIFALIWSVVRAHVQAITIDEADTYQFFIEGPVRFTWHPSSNNHFLNSLLARLTTNAFGPSIPAIRLPALIGGALYIASCVACCLIIGRQLRLRLLLLCALLYNPFIADYLVVARGYGLAIGFFVAALATLLLAVGTPRRELAFHISCARASSVLSALSFAANFSFAFVNLALASVFFAFLLRKAAPVRAVVAAVVVPGLIVGAILTAPILLRWPPGHLWYGANTLSETVFSITASVFDLNTSWMPAPLQTIVDQLSEWLPVALLATGLLTAVPYYLVRPGGCDPGSGGQAVASSAFLVLASVVRR